MANVGVVYSTNTGRIRWINVPDKPGDETKGVNLLAGEAIAVLPKSDAPTLQTAVNGLTGKVPSGDRYVLVPVGPTALFNVTTVLINMDPLIDQPPNGMQLIAHATAGPGWTYSSAGGLSAPLPPSVKP